MFGHELILKMGNPLLRQVSESFTKDEILSEETKDLVNKNRGIKIKPSTNHKKNILIHYPLINLIFKFRITK